MPGKSRQILGRRLAGSLSTPDRRGRRLMQEQRYTKPRPPSPILWLDVAELKAGNFKAARIFGGMDTPEVAFDQGNALVMLGKVR